MSFLDYTRSNRSGPQSPRPRRRRDPSEPQRGESFADYYLRRPNMPAADAGRGQSAALRSMEREEINRVGRAGETRRDSIRFGLRHAVGRAVLDHANAGSGRILDIPMGQHLIRSNLDPGIPEAHSYTIRNGQIGVIRWGTDTRRPLAEVFTDIERATGTPEGYLLRLANKESAGDVNATPGTSSATGYFQVIDDTWASWVDNPRFREAYGIVMDRDELAQYRGDARVDGAIAAEIARTNADWFRRNGIQPTEKHLYLGHFGGPNGLVMARDQARGGFTREYGFQYFNEAERNANSPIFWEPKRDANNEIVYRYVERNGRTVRVEVPNYDRPRTSQQVWDRLTDRFQDTPVTFRQRANGTEELLAQ